MKLMCSTTGFVLKQTNIRTGFYNNEAAAVPQPSTLFLLVFVSDIVPVGIIAVVTVGSSILLLMFLLALAFFLYRQRKGSKCTQFSLMCVCVGACAHVSRRANSMCLSVFLSSTFHICHSASPAMQHLIQMRLMNIHIIWQSALKRLPYISLFILLTWKWWIIF